MCVAMFWSQSGPVCLAPSACRSLLELPRQPADLQLLNTTKCSETRKKPFWSAFRASVAVQIARNNAVIDFLLTQRLYCCAVYATTDRDVSLDHDLITMQQVIRDWLCIVTASCSSSSWQDNDNWLWESLPLRPWKQYRLQEILTPQLNTQKFTEIHKSRTWHTQGCIDCSCYQRHKSDQHVRCNLLRRLISLSSLQSKLAKLLWPVHWKTARSTQKYTETQPRIHRSTWRYVEIQPRVQSNTVRCMQIQAITHRVTWRKLARSSRCSSCTMRAACTKVVK